MENPLNPLVRLTASFVRADSMEDTPVVRLFAREADRDLELFFGVLNETLDFEGARYTTLDSGEAGNIDESSGLPILDDTFAAISPEEFVPLGKSILLHCEGDDMRQFIGNFARGMQDFAKENPEVPVAVTLNFVTLDDDVRLTDAEIAETARRMEELEEDDDDSESWKNA